VAVAGATLATGGAAGLAVAAAAAVGAGTAAAANSAGQAADASQVEERNKRGREGRLILAVRTRSPEQADQVMGLMQQAGATKTPPVERADQALTAGVTSASWTGS
jgi:Spy/CpxP family protein refolding chaperone